MILVGNSNRVAAYVTLPLNQQWPVTASDRFTLKLYEFFDGPSKPHLHGSFDKHSDLLRGKVACLHAYTFRA